ncbi:MAG: hypothetical protein Q9211_004265 [Gyalolechia sp. 1 TL-2023]
MDQPPGSRNVIIIGGSRDERAVGRKQLGRWVADSRRLVKLPCIRHPTGTFQPCAIGAQDKNKRLNPGIGSSTIACVDACLCGCRIWLIVHGVVRVDAADETEISSVMVRYTTNFRVSAHRTVLCLIQACLHLKCTRVRSNGGLWLFCHADIGGLADLQLTPGLGRWVEVKARAFLVADPREGCGVRLASSILSRSLTKDGKASVAFIRVKPGCDFVPAVPFQEWCIEFKLPSGVQGLSRMLKTSCSTRQVLPATWLAKDVPLEGVDTKDRLGKNVPAPQRRVRRQGTRNRRRTAVDFHRWDAGQRMCSLAGDCCGHILLLATVLLIAASARLARSDDPARLCIDSPSKSMTSSKTECDR